MLINVVRVSRITKRSEDSSTLSRWKPIKENYSRTLYLTSVRQFLRYPPEDSPTSGTNERINFPKNAASYRHMNCLGSD